MQPWIIIILIVVTCLTILMYTRSGKGKVSEGFGQLFDQQSAYANTQYTAYHDQGFKGIFTQPGAPTADINASINSPDLYLPDSPDRDYSTYLKVDPSFEYTGKDALCRGATMPKNLPERIPQHPYNCGWWFVADPAVPSVGAAGIVQTPLFPDKLPPGGEWIWDLNKAQQMEEIKNCSRITDCDLIDVPGIKGECGFCLSKGYAVPIDSSGNESYPDVESACGIKPIVTPEKCHLPPPSVNVVSGIQCDATLGHPSPDNTLRFYTDGECNKMGGKWYSNGECLVKTGGSYTYTCAINNAPPSLQAAEALTVCTPGRDGNLTRTCMISIAKGLGYNPKGTVLRLLYSTARPVGNDAAAIQILRNAGISAPDAVFGQGNIDKQSVAEIYTNIWNAMKNGKTPLVKLAATYLVIGSADFDICRFEDNEMGPFPTMCVERAFRQAGCQPAGSAVPTDANVGQFMSKSWGDVKKYFADLYRTMNDASAENQDDAMTKCLGIKFVRPLPIGCKNPGMERLWYSAQYDNFWSKDCNERNWASYGSIRYPAFMGRDVNTNGWSQISSYDNTGIGKSRHNFAYMKSRTIINPGDSKLGGSFDIWVDDGFRLAVNGTETYARAVSQLSTHYIVPVMIPAGSDNIIEMFYNNGGPPGQMIIGGEFFEQLNMSGQLPFPESAPVVAFDFFRGTDKDRHGTVMSMNVGCSIGSVGGIQCITTGGGKHIQILTPIRHKVIKTYTWYAKATSTAITAGTTLLCMSEWPNINTTDNLNFVGDNQQTRAAIEFAGRIAFSAGGGQEDKPLMNGAFLRNLWYGVGGAGWGTGAQTDWHHYAAVQHPYGFLLYIDGVNVGNVSNPDLYANVAGSWTPFADFIMRQVFIGRSADNRFTGGEAWRDAVLENADGGANIAFVHMYDRALSPEEIKNEMNYMNDPIYNNGPDLSAPSNEIVTINDQYFGQTIAMGWSSDQRVRG